jgi:hypothetical protein
MGRPGGANDFGARREGSKAEPDISGPRSECRSVNRAAHR